MSVAIILNMLANMHQRQSIHGEIPTERMVKCFLNCLCHYYVISNRKYNYSECIWMDCYYAIHNTIDIATL